MWVCAMPATRSEGGCEFVPRLPRETMVDVSLCHACHAKWRGVTRDQGAPKPDPSAPPTAIVPRLPRKTLVDVRLCHACHAKRRWMWVCATPATRNEGGCEFVPRLPRETMVDVSLCHACHAKWRGVTRDQGAPKPDPSAPPTAMSATPATRNEGGCEFVPHLPRETRVDVSLCHACHAKWRGVTRDQGAPKPDPSAPPTAMSATPATRNEGGCEFVPRLPRETRVDVSLCHACHAKRWWMWVCATPATQNGAASRATRARPNQTQARHPLPWVPRLPRETKVDVSLCHACHAKRRWMWVCATPATRNDGGCEFVPCLPRKMARRHARPGRAQNPSAPPTAMSATPATRNEGGCVFVPRLPRETRVDVSLCHACQAKWRGARPGRAQTRPKRATHCHECHACHAKRRWMWVCATPATRNEGGCEFVPRLPRETRVDVSLCHACHAKWRGITRDQGAPKPDPSAPATHCHERHACHAKRRWMRVCATPATQNGAATPATWYQGGCHQVPRLPVCVYVKFVCVCVKLLYVKCEKLL